MSSLRQEMEKDIANAIAIYDECFEWAGAKYPCVERDQPTARELQDEGGFVEGVSKALVVAKTAFAKYVPGVFPQDQGVFPQDGDLIDGARYQIKQRNGHKDRHAAQLVLYIGSVDA